ncbi:PBP1b-binding outer membrane lipoprotein LpoB [Rhodopirellula rubra]|uniref:PBP1b-binding outer membrane lipoprotein LpoB n=1 Tax=Aporhodopirellula rubra TaxID=980271 RepID=A0A7W5H8E3_9BACT|nr:hypothetical protein [Aporhodopirellula rubra]MBB3208911.1 PBP1b-binding outer membrane lipoprotein LpoB [Aporhodopirellula rubra]
MRTQTQQRLLDAATVDGAIVRQITPNDVVSIREIPKDIVAGIDVEEISQRFVETLDGAGGDMTLKIQQTTEALLIDMTVTVEPNARRR